MNVQDLLTAPFMRGSVLIAGEGGLLNEVTWAAPDADLEFNNWILPGLLVVATQEYLKDEDALVYFNRVLVHKPAVVVYFPKGRPGYTARETMNKTAVRWHDENNIPLICITRQTSTISFLKNFSITAATWFNQEDRERRWLEEICMNSEFAGAESVAKTCGYNPDYVYYASSLSITRKRQEKSPINAEIEINAASGFLHRELGFKEAPVLSYTTPDSVISFIPRKEDETRLEFRDRILNVMHKPHSEVSESKWKISLGTKARSISHFHQSYVNALKTKDLVNSLKITDRVTFYNDWYMHMLLLDEDREVLQEQMEYTLNPILDSPELLDTLSDYLYFGESLKTTSEQIFIHVNTLKYRLKRISKLLGCNLDDPNVRFRLRIAITIYKYLEGSTERERERERNGFE